MRRAPCHVTGSRRPVTFGKDSAPVRAILLRPEKMLPAHPIVANKATCSSRHFPPPTSSANSNFTSGETRARKGGKRICLMDDAIGFYSGIDDGQLLPLLTWRFIRAVFR